MKETYGVGLLVFHMYCDLNYVEEDKRCPVNPNLLLEFLSSCTGAYSGSAIANFMAGIKAWHLLHGRAWIIQLGELKTLLEGATILAPPSLKCYKRQPFTPEFMAHIYKQMDLDKPLDAAVYACMTIMFYSIACSPSIVISLQRLGEFMVKTIKDFDPHKHITRNEMSEATDLNLGGSGEHLFAWNHRKGLQPLSKTEFIKRLMLATSTAKLPDLEGHRLHIGGTLEYLLREVLFDIILAPYIQPSPALEPFMRYTLPPVC
ncbi:hypothetical protein BDR06DRAFT_983376 [Suillus hirtellus]|nr:hypothetical protein BDR06DRAFT_983376 [Suillus hirtellus]